LTKLAEALSQAGPYHDEDVEEARLVALHYVQARAALFHLAEKCLRANDKWTAEDEKSFKDKMDEMTKLRLAWEALLSK